MSKPVLGMIVGLVLGLVAGLLAIAYFDITERLGQVCLAASIMMFAQLLGATIGAAIGKPAEANNAGAEP